MKYKQTPSSTHTAAYRLDKNRIAICIAHSTEVIVIIKAKRNLKWKWTSNKIETVSIAEPLQIRQHAPNS